MINIKNHNTIPGLIEAQVARHPEKVAAILENEAISYLYINEKANQLAHYLIKLGVKQDTPVALCMDRSFDVLISMLAILKAGGAYLPLDKNYPEERLSFILSDNHTPALIIQSDLKEKFVGYQGKLIVLNAETAINDQPTHNVPASLRPILPNNLAYIIYTSGSTGMPKGVLIEQHGVVDYCQWFLDYSDCKQDARIDFSSSYVFDMAVTTSIVPLMLGLTIVLGAEDIKENPRNYIKHLVDNKVNGVKITPSYFRVLLHELEADFIPLPDLQFIVLGGENLTTADCTKWLSIYPQHVLFNEYGPTEATVAITSYKICQQNVGSLGVDVPIGKPGALMQCYILNANMEQTSQGKIGQLYIGGGGLARGYLNQPKMTVKKFIQPPLAIKTTGRLYKTGDLCRQRPDGAIEYVGRIDTQVKIRGYRVEPGEIEKQLKTHVLIDEAVVLAQDDEHHEKQLLAFYSLKQDSESLDFQHLREYLQQKLPHYMIPSRLIKVHSFPLTLNGKLDRNALLNIQVSNEPHGGKPHTALEQILLEIWSDEFGITTIGIEDNFFELGGHSLAATRIISKIHTILGKEIHLHEFYQALTISRLSVCVQHAPNSDKNRGAVVGATDDNASVSLNDFQLLLWLSGRFEPKAKKINIVIQKRLCGHLDRIALTWALNALFIRYEIFYLRPLKFNPMQAVNKKNNFKLVDTDLSDLSDESSESILRASTNSLTTYASWQKHFPMLLVKLFYLKNNECELQLCLPHIICDDVSLNIILTDLSNYYQDYIAQSSTCGIETNSSGQYRKYLAHEQFEFQTHMSADQVFWNDYLKQTSLFYFPSEYIVNNMELRGFSYSTYTQLSEQSLSQLKQFCTINRFTINDGLCAALALALLKFGSHKTQSIFMNIVKSTRHEHQYDHTVGCFLTIEPIKITVPRVLTLEELAKQVHRSVIDTGTHQHCPSLIKLSSLQSFQHQRKKIRRSFIKFGLYLYGKLFSISKFHYRVMSCCESLSVHDYQNEFLININIQNNFLAHRDKKHESSLFGFKVKNATLNPTDLMKINHFFDVCFQRDDVNVPYLVISANLTPAFREAIAREFVEIITAGTEIDCAAQV